MVDRNASSPLAPSAGGVHDLNNLLLIIRETARVLEERLEASDARRQDASEILQTSDRAIALAERLLGKPIAGKQAGAHNATEVLRRLEPALRRVNPQGIQLSLEMPNERLETSLSATDIERIVLNLALNARDAISGNGRITVKLGSVDVPEGATGPGGAQPGRHLLLTVSDSGSGIPPAVAERVFEPAFTTKGSSGGSGLGLASVRALARAGGGDVDFITEVGTGTTFRVCVPISTGAVRRADTTPAAADSPAVTTKPIRHYPKEPPPIPSPSRERGRSAQGTGTILVVDDERALRGLMRRILERQGFTVVEGHNGRHALDLLRSMHAAIDLVVSDVVMPEMNGPEFVRQARGLGIQTPVFYVSGYVADSATLLHQDDAELLRKPFNAPDFLDRVTSALQAPAAATAA